MTLLDVLIKRAEAISLSDGDIGRICLDRVRFVTYDELDSISDIHELFIPYNAFILYYTTTSNFVGHWCAVIFHQSENAIEFFDSYGLNDRKILSLAADSFSDVSGIPLLTQLLNNASQAYGCKIQWPIKRLQSKNVDAVATCGRYAALRLRFANLSQKQFVNMLSDKNWTSDSIVTMLTVMFSEEADDMVERVFKK